MSFKNNTNHQLTNTMEQTMVRYANKLEESNGFSIQLDFNADDDEYEIYLVDPCGDLEGDPWTNWSDFVHDTESQISPALV
jgi:hypothetical protein